MNFEQPSQIPEENELPLRVSESEKISSPGRESDIYRVEAENPETNEQESLVLKEIKVGNIETVEESFEEAREAMEFHSFLKSTPELAEFVPDTLHFIARKKPGGPPRSFRLQRHIEGKRLDQISDDEIDQDLALGRELLKCVGAFIPVFEEQIANGGNLPDLYGSKPLQNLLFNPRQTANIMIADKPDERGHRIFFIDTARESSGKENKAIGWYQKKVGAPMQLLRLKRWRQALEKKFGATEKLAQDAVSDSENIQSGL